MGALAVLALVPHVVLLPPDAPADLQPLAETCAQAIAASPALRVTRLGPVAASSAVIAERARADLTAAAQSYRDLSFADARDQAERAIAALEPQAATDEDFELLVEARLRLALTLLAQRKNAPAQRALEAAARIRPDAVVTEGDYPPNLVAAFERARATVRRDPPVPIEVTAHTAIAGIEPTVLVDGRPLRRGGPGVLPGEHVVVVVAPGHRPIRQTVRAPLSAPLTVALEPLAPVDSGIVVALSVERTSLQVRLKLRRAEGAEASRDADIAGAPVAARELAEALAGVPRAIATSGAGAGDRQNGRIVAAGGHASAGARGRDGRAHHDEGGSIFGTWWFWTITGSVVAVGVLGVVAARSGDPGTDVHVGVTE